MPVNEASFQTIIDQLRLLIDRHYPSLSHANIRHLVSGMHDNYLIQHGENKFILRLYHHHWRTPEEIHYELALLNHLSEYNCPVAAPVTTAEGDTCFTLGTTDGARQAALFAFIEGMSPQRNMTSQQAYALGRELAGIHLASADFTTAYRRQRLDTDYLLYQSVDVILPYLPEMQQHSLKNIADAIAADLPELPMSPPCLTICHGDPNPGNLLFDASGTLHLIDFDQCGPGWRMFDIAKFLAAVHQHDELAGIKQACVDGYSSVSKPNTREIAALPLLAQIAAIWVAAIQIYNRPLTAVQLADTARWQQRLDVISNLPGLLAG